MRSELSTHIGECAQLRREIFRRLGKQDALTLAVGSTLFSGMGFIIWFLLTHKGAFAG